MEILNDTIEGRAIIEQYQQKKPLLSKLYRKEVINSIVAFWVKSKLKVTPKYYELAANEIIRLFPKERKVNHN